MWLCRIYSWIHPCWGEVSGRFASQCHAEVSRAAWSCPWPGWAQPQEVLNKCRSILALLSPVRTFYPAHPAFAFDPNSKPADLLLRFLSVVLLCLHGLLQRSCVHFKHRMQHDLEKTELSLNAVTCDFHLHPSFITHCNKYVINNYVPTDLQCFSEVQDIFSSQV